jgi:type I restriction enzyme S subunit
MNSVPAMQRTLAWEQRKVGDVFIQTAEYVNPQAENIELWSLTVEKGLTPKTERYVRDFLVLKDDKYKAVRPNDVIYNPMNMTLGAIGYNDMSKTVAVSGYYVTMKPSKEVDGYYIKTWMQLPQSIELYKAHATGSLLEKQRVQYPTFSEIKFIVPDLSEQRRIGTFFRNLDNLITLHQREHVKLQNTRKTLPKKMLA